MQSTYFNTKQAAQRYGLSASWLSKLRVFGGGSPYLKIGRRVVYERSAFERWLALHARESTSQAPRQEVCTDLIAPTPSSEVDASDDC